MEALEALQLYCPMAHALGLSRLSASIEDICFQVRRPPQCHCLVPLLGEE